MDNNVFFRLKNERLRLGYGQSDIAETTNVSLKTVQRWEKEVPIPSDKLAMLANLNFDVLFILVGQRSEAWLTKNENRMIEKYRQANADVREEVLMLLMDGTDSKATSNVANNHKNSVKGQQIGNNNQQHNHFASQQNSSINIENQHGGSNVGIKNK